MELSTDFQEGAAIKNTFYYFFIQYEPNIFFFKLSTPLTNDCYNKT